MQALGGSAGDAAADTSMLERSGFGAELAGAVLHGAHLLEGYGMTMAVSPRPHIGWVLIAPEPPQRTLAFSDSPNRELVWAWPLLACSDAVVGRALFAGTLAEKNRSWREFRNYVRQGHTYDSAARLVGDRTRALLQYYRMLNLAKAELLRVAPGQIIGQPINHGLSLVRTKSGTLAGDRLVVKNGVFPLLYESRIGRQLAVKTEIPVTRLIGIITEVGMEREHAHLGESLETGLMHSVRVSDSECWSVLALVDPAPLLACTATRKLLAEHYEEIPLPQQWKEEFAVSRRMNLSKVRIYQSKWTVPDQNDLLGCARKAYDCFAPYIGYSHTPFDGELYASLYKSKDFPMPADLARYALVFYLSSLVRYHPSVLDPVTQPAQSWFFDRFVQESDLPMLIDAANGIRGHRQVFYGPETLRA